MTERELQTVETVCADAEMPEEALLWGNRR